MTKSTKPINIFRIIATNTKMHVEFWCPHPNNQADTADAVYIQCKKFYKDFNHPFTYSQLVPIAFFDDEALFLWLLKHIEDHVDENHRNENLRIEEDLQTAEDM